MCLFIKCGKIKQSWRRFFIPKRVIVIYKNSVITSDLIIDGDLLVEKNVVVYVEKKINLKIKGELIIDGDVKWRGISLREEFYSDN